MAYTSHGHHIQGSAHDNLPVERARCGGPTRCRRCNAEESEWLRENSFLDVEIKPGDNEANYQNQAIELVWNFLEEHYASKGENIPEGMQVYVVWFCKTLQNWKAMLGTSARDGFYFEVTHNGHAGETYVDGYSKFINFVVRDGE